MTTEELQCFLGGLKYYKLRRKDGSLAIDGIPGLSTRQAVRSFQADYGLTQDGDPGPKTQQAIREAIAKTRKPVKGASTEGYQWIDPEDFRCKCGGRYCNGWPEQPHKKTMDLLEQFGEHFHRRPVVHSGLRCETWNRLQGGAPFSKHRFGAAVDFHIDGVSHTALRDYAEELMPDWGGVGIYNWGIHIDDRPVKGRWDNRK